METMISGLYGLLIEGSFCDVELVIGNLTIYSHKVILSSVSDYFKMLFVRNLNCNRFEFYFMDYSSVKLLVEYIYTGKLEIDERNMIDLLICSKFLSIQNAFNECVDFIRSRITIDNCLTMLKFARSYGIKRILDRSMNTILENFTILKEYPEFLTLSTDVLLEIISRDDLNVESEDEVVLSVIKWMKYKRRSRHRYVSKLLQHCRLYQVKLGTMNIVREETDNDSSIWDTILSCVTKHPRKSTMGNIYSIGAGFSNYIERYDVRFNKWEKVTIVPNSSSWSGLAALDKILYVIGGIENGTVSNTVYKFNLVTNKWSFAPSLNERRYGSGIAVMEGRIYVVGGLKSSTSYLKTVERLSPEGVSWERFSELPIELGLTSATASDTALYAVGSACGENVESIQEYLGVMFWFDRDSDRWKTCSKMNVPRINCSIVSNNDKNIYAIGGSCIEIATPSNIFSNPSNAIEKYNTVTDSWTTLSSMIRSRVFPSSCILSGDLYIVGGINPCDSNNDDVISKSTEMLAVNSNSNIIMGELNTDKMGQSSSVVVF